MVAIGDVLQIMIAFGTLVVQLSRLHKKRSNHRPQRS